jgi:phosphatidate cytidylyltransferase
MMQEKLSTNYGRAQMKLNNLAQRVGVALLGIPLIIGAVLYGGILFFLLVQIIGIGVLYEFYLLSEKKFARPHRLLGMAGLTAILIYFAFDTVSPSFTVYETSIVAGRFLAVGFITFLILAISLELLNRNGSPFLNLGTTTFGVLYVGIGLGTFLGLRELFSGGEIIVLMLCTIWVCDTAAYIAGKSIGKHKLYMAVSPNKTIEGAVFGFIFAVGAAILSKYLFVSYINVWDAIMIGVIVGTVGQIGDLAESMFKRDVDVKDSSSFFPGHGGFLDRFDSILFVSPAVYIYGIVGMGL